MKYTTRGVCSRSIEFDVVDNKVTGVKFEGGCSGNTQGVAALVEGMDVNEAIKRMEGIKCGFKQHPVLTSLQLHSSNILPISNLWEILNASNEYI